MNTTELNAKLQYVFEGIELTKVQKGLLADVLTEVIEAAKEGIEAPNYGKANYTSDGLMSKEDYTKFHKINSTLIQSLNKFEQTENGLYFNYTIVDFDDTATIKEDNIKLAEASSTMFGVIMLGYSQNDKNYPIQLDENGKAYVNVPWTDNNTTYSNATTTTAGLMSSTDKSKLDNIAANANNYTLPTASSSVLGGVKSSITGTTSERDYLVQVNTDGTMKVNVPWSNTTYAVATTSANGLMSSADKTKLDGIATGANKYTLPAASDSVIGGVKKATVSYDSSTAGADLVNLITALETAGIITATDTHSDGPFVDEPSAT